LSRHRLAASWNGKKIKATLGEDVIITQLQESGNLRLPRNWAGKEIDVIPPEVKDSSVSYGR